MPKYIFTPKERKVLQTYLQNGSLTNPHIRVILHRLIRMDMKRLRDDLTLAGRIRERLRK